MPTRILPHLDRYLWNDRAQRYASASTGRFVARAVVHQALEQVAAGSQVEMELLARRLVDGQIDLAEWRAAMRQEIKTAHTVQAALGRGGWDQMSPSDWGWTGREIRRQYDYLERFVAQIASGKQPLNGNLLRRARLYALAGRRTFEEMRRRSAAMHGATEKRRVLGLAEHCVDSKARPGCLEQAQKGWVPIDSHDLAQIGACTCLTACKCRYEFRDGAGKVIG